MPEHGLSPFAAWEGFYVIIGTSAAALTGLQFVVIALIAQERVRSTMPEIDAYSTPTVVHFSAVLMIAAILGAPWHSLSTPAIVLAPVGVAGMVYAAIVARRARQQTRYKPVLEDWIWHIVLPVVAHAALVGASIALWGHRGGALFLIGAVAVLLLFVGIHNAWDAVTYITIERLRSSRIAEKHRENA
jgi:hypothetical protein